MVFNLIIMGMWVVVGAVAAGMALFVLVDGVVRRVGAPARADDRPGHQDAAVSARPIRTR